MRLSIIAAVAENGVIGRGNDLPWRLSADLRRFKQLTMGHAVIMGRKTWESIGRPLPGRRMIVVTRQTDFQAEGVELAASLPIACGIAAAANAVEAFLIGGAEIYRQALPLADRLYLTRVHAAVAGDKYFPAYDAGEWRLASAESFRADEKNNYDTTFEIYERTAALPVGARRE
jgi:dihydrofolate reductase